VKASGTPRPALRFAFWVVLAGCPVFAVAAQAEPAPGTPEWFARHAFDGQDGCLAVRRNQSLKPGDEVFVFTADAEAVRRRIAQVVDGDSLKPIFAQRGFKGVYADTALWARIGCFWALGMLDDPPALSIARYEPYREESSCVLAITNLPRSSLVIGGAARALGGRELAQLEARCASLLPSEFSSSNPLVAGQRFESAPGHELVELFVGRPFGGAEPGTVIDSVHVVRAFLHNDTVLCSEQFSRVSGREERVETDAPQLTSTNWFENWDETLGFVSYDRGATWIRLGFSAGFEGLVWWVTKLTRGMPWQWSFYLYTRH